MKRFYEAYGKLQTVSAELTGKLQPVAGELEKLQPLVAELSPKLQTVSGELIFKVPWTNHVKYWLDIMQIKNPNRSKLRGI